MRKIRVLVVDDSAFMRKVISDILTSDNSIEVVDTARDGIWAIEKLKSINVDIVTLDVEMPRMNGLEALKIIKDKYRIPVLMLSSLTKDGADTTIKALEIGAYDFVLKPQQGHSFDMNALKDELILKVKLCCRGILKPSTSGISVEQAAIKTDVPAKKVNAKDSKIKAVCMAASTGGPKALAKVISEFPRNFILPVLVVQHMPSGFTNAFAARLNNCSSLTVKEAEDGDKLMPGMVYIAPGGYHMVVQSGGNTIGLNQQPQMHGVRPCADKLFISAAENIDGRVIGVVLTGMGRDGTDGLDVIKQKGGICIAEHESTCTIYGMPKSAIEKGVVDIITPLSEVVNSIISLAKE